MHKDIEHIMIAPEEIDKILTRLADEINRDYAGKDKKLVMVCILKGSIMIMSDLMKKITVPMETEYMRVSSYGGGMTTTGNVKIILDLMRDDLDTCDLLLIEDIIDSGHTLKKLTEYLRSRGAKSVKTLTMLDKPYRREVDVDVDYVGIEIPDEFVVGYGMDYDERYRELPYFGILKPEVYA